MDLPDQRLSLPEKCLIFVVSAFDAFFEVPANLLSHRTFVLLLLINRIFCLPALLVNLSYRFPVLVQYLSIRLLPVN